MTESTKKTTTTKTTTTVFDVEKATPAALLKAKDLKVSGFKPTETPERIDAAKESAAALPEDVAKIMRTAETAGAKMDLTLTRAAYKAAGAAYVQKNPKIVTAFLSEMGKSAVLSVWKNAARRYFQAWGFEFYERPRFEAASIIDRKAQTERSVEMKKTTICAFKVDEEARAARAAEEQERVKAANTAARTAEAATRVAEAAKKKAAAERDKKTPDLKKVEFYEQEAKFARTAADCSELISFIAEAGLDPAKVLKYVKSLKELDALK